MTLLLRGTLWLLILSVVMVGVFVLLGYRIETEAVTMYQNIDYRGAVHVLDTQRLLGLDLSGKRCFKKLVELGDIYENHPAGFMLRDDHSAMAVERLSCARIRAGTLLIWKSQ